MSALEKAKSISIMDYLSKSGYKPVKETSSRATFLSPLRPENDASFVVHKIANRWFDYGPRHGGDIIDIVQAVEGKTTKEAVQSLLDGEGLRVFNPDDYKNVQETKIIVDSIGALTAPPLLEYIESRRINIDVANKYCVQVKWQFSSNKAAWNFGIGFRNDADGLEIRSKDHKVGTSPKTYRTIGEYTQECNVFEGFFDYMSCLSEHGVTSLKNQTYVLNSLAFVHIMIEPLRGYEKVNVFFDNDPAGDDKINLLIDEGVVVEDRRSIFQGYEDYNDYWMKKK